VQIRFKREMSFGWRSGVPGTNTPPRPPWVAGGERRRRLAVRMGEEHCGTEREVSAHREF